MLLECGLHKHVNIERAQTCRTLMLDQSHPSMTSREPHSGTRTGARFHLLELGSESYNLNNVLL